jgi:hypothetical protein
VCLCAQSGRSLAFSWNVTALNSEAATAPAFSGTEYTQTTAALTLSASDLAPGGQYHVVLTVMNFLGGLSSISSVVNVANIPLPRISIDGPAVVDIPADRRIKLMALGYQSTSSCRGSNASAAATSPALSYAWRLESVGRIPGDTETDFVVNATTLVSLAVFVSRDPTMINLPLLQVLYSIFT